jgi:hypothetical protein
MNIFLLTKVLMVFLSSLNAECKVKLCFKSKIGRGISKSQINQCPDDANEACLVF